MYCLWCDEEIIIEINWDNLFKLSKPQLLCDKCMNQLEMIEGDRCVKCSRSYQGELCFDCQRWTDKDPLIFNYSLYTYNEQMQEMIARWKYRRDYVLATIFREYYVKTFVKIFSFLGENIYIIPIPLSEDRMMERGFNQAKVLADFLPYQQKNVMQRIFSEKQSKKTRFERISMKNPFILEENINKTVILVDDIYTTGTTLRHAGNLLKENGCPKVFSYTLIRG